MGSEMCIRDRCASGRTDGRDSALRVPHPSLVLTEEADGIVTAVVIPLAYAAAEIGRRTVLASGVIGLSLIPARVAQEGSVCPRTARMGPGGSENL